MSKLKLASTFCLDSVAIILVNSSMFLSNINQYGYCKYEMTCKFDHPKSSPSVSETTEIAPNPRISDLQMRINKDDPALWHGIESYEPKDNLVLFREMTLFGLDRDNLEDYPKYFDIKARLAPLQVKLRELVRAEMSILGDEYWEIKSEMARHEDIETAVRTEEMEVYKVKEVAELYVLKRDMAYDSDSE